MNVGIIGAGAIARFLLNQINQEQAGDLQIKSVFVRDREKYRTLEAEYGVMLFTDLDAFLESGIDIVVEAANINAVKTLIPDVLKEKEAVLISVGALADGPFLREVTETAHKSHHPVHLPSGAVGGLDIIQNAHALGKITDVMLTTRKPAHSLVEDTINEAKVIFEGKAADAIKQFPKNINVSIVLSLAGIGIEQTKVILIADPKITQNIHEVKVKGDFGEADISIKNNPLPENPKTSYLAAMSVLGTLKRIDSGIRIG